MLIRRSNRLLGSQRQCTFCDNHAINGKSTEDRMCIIDPNLEEVIFRPRTDSAEPIKSIDASEYIGIIEDNDDSFSQDTCNNNNNNGTTNEASLDSFNDESESRTSKIATRKSTDLITAKKPIKRVLSINKSQRSSVSSSSNFNKLYKKDRDNFIKSNGASISSPPTATPPLPTPRNLDKNDRSSLLQEQYIILSSDSSSDSLPPLSSSSTTTTTLDKNSRDRQLNKRKPKRIKVELYKDDNVEKEYVRHRCSTRCCSNRPSRKLNINGILIKPLLYGWDRIRSLDNEDTNKHKITYRTPCGAIFWSIDEVDSYLLVTDNILSIDSFTFDSDVYLEYKFYSSVWPKVTKSKDITQGRELIPVQCINEVDNDDPDIIDYQSERLPLEGIPLNRNPLFLVGCECTDNCRDKTKCACWQRTLEGVQTLRNLGYEVPNGYSFRRLSSVIKSGIYECNSQCKCDRRCANRVAQNGVNFEMQLFKTLQKGWGIRILTDIPKGSFISTYTGHILAERHMSTRKYCDQYFADLDFIECLEGIKGIKSGKSFRTLLGDQQMYVLDGKICGNVGRYFNHSCEPNLFVQNVFIDTYDLRFPTIAFFSKRAIRAGEELCWDYQYEVDSVPGRKIMCRCGAKKCRGRLL